MTLTLVGTPDHGYGAERCADCSAPMPERAPECDCAERRCETCWWAHEVAAWKAGETVAAIALSHIETNHRQLQHQDPKIRERAESFFARHGRPERQ